MDYKTEIDELVNKLNILNYYYYTLDNPKVSDAEYDKLYDRLIELEKKTGYVNEFSPTQRIGDEILDKFQKHKHLSKLYSLDKSQNFSELEDWINRNDKTLISLKAAENFDISYIIELKYDGLTINLTYDEGKLVSAATRGNGITGEEILPQIKTIKSIPLQVSYKGKFEIQGEGLMPISQLTIYNKTAVVPLKNPRNAAAGALRNLNSAETKKRNLTAYFYNIGYIEGKNFKNQEEMFLFMKENHFKVNDFLKKAYSIDDMKAVINEADILRKELDILTDGIVIKINDLRTRELLGYTNKFPRWAMAYKFEAEEYSTILKEVLWNVGRTGKVTPLAVLEPVEIGNVSVQRATLNNYEDILRKNLMINSRVLIRRSNEVIPEILGALDNDDQNTIEIEKPKKCPSCNTTLIEEGPNLFCPNSISCKPQLISRLVHFASRDAMNIEGLSEKTVEKLMDVLGVYNIWQIYDLTFDDFLKIEGFKDKKTNNLLNAINNSKNVKLSAFLYSLGIPNIGIKTARMLALEFNTMDNFLNANYNELVKIQDIGDITAKEIITFINDENIVSGINLLISKGIVIISDNVEKTDLTGKKIVITGSIEGINRKDLESRLENLGASISSSVSKNTDFLIVGEKPGTKLTKAEELGIKIYNIEEFNRDFDI